MWEAVINPTPLIDDRPVELALRLPMACKLPKPAAGGEHNHDYFVNSILIFEFGPRAFRGRS